MKFRFFINSHFIQSRNSDVSDVMMLGVEGISLTIFFKEFLFIKYLKIQFSEIFKFFK